MFFLTPIISAFCSAAAALGYGALATGCVLDTGALTDSAYMGRVSRKIKLRR